MKKIILSTVPVFALLGIFSSCDHEDASPARDPDATAVNLDIHLHYPDLVSFDSANVVFKNSTMEVKLRLNLDNASHVATGHITDLPCGEWKVSTAYFNTIDHGTVEKNGVVKLQITPTATDLISTEAFVFVEEKADPIDLHSFKWTDYCHHQIFLENKREGFVRLPRDPTNPFMEITTVNPRWTYVFADRSFYNRNSEATSNYYQGSCAFEVYGKGGDNYDLLENHIIDTTSLESGISRVRDKVWNFVDGVILMYDTGGNEFLLFHTWDLRISGGRIKSVSPAATRSRSEIEIRKNGWITK